MDKKTNAAEPSGPTDCSSPRFIGSFYTDSATVLVGDPCRLLPSEEETPLTYDDFCDAAQKTGQVLGTIQLGDAFAPIAIRTGADGWCHVYIDQSTNELIVQLDTKVENNP